MDMVLVRNIIIHEGGLPSEHHFRQNRTLGVIKISSTIKLSTGEASFYRLDLTEKDSVSMVLMAVKSMSEHLYNNVRKA